MILLDWITSSSRDPGALLRSERAYRLAWFRARLAAGIAGGMYASGRSSMATPVEALQVADEILRGAGLVDGAECSACGAPQMCCLCGQSQ